MKRSTRTAAALTLAALTLGAPAAAHAGVIKDKTGDADGTVAELNAAADIKQVKVKAKKTKVTVAIQGVDFPAVETGIGVLTDVNLSTDADEVMFGNYTIVAGPAPQGVYGACTSATVAFDAVANTITYTLPRSCFGSATRITSVDVMAASYDTSNTSPSGDVTSDDVSSAKKIRLPGKKK